MIVAVEVDLQAEAITLISVNVKSLADKVFPRGTQGHLLQKNSMSSAIPSTI